MEAAILPVPFVLTGVLALALPMAGGWTLSSGAVPARTATPAAVDSEDPAKPGQYMWQPERSPDGPVVIVVSIPEQRAHVYRNGVEIGVSTVSTGRPGHQTPTGVFTILEKQKTHESSIYKGASMPYMERLTWDGIAMHAGNLPGYPASHGCVRLPLEFSQLLYGVTEKGGTVVIADEKSPEPDAAHPGELLAPAADSGAVKFQWQPEKSPAGPVTIVLSAKDRRLYVYRNGIEIGWSDVTLVDPSRPIGSRVYTVLAGTSDEPNRWVPGRPMARWQAIQLGGGPKQDMSDLPDRVKVSRDFANSVFDLIVPGTTLYVTDAAADPPTRSAPGFTVLSAGPEPGGK